MKDCVLHHPSPHQRESRNLHELKFIEKTFIIINKRRGDMYGNLFRLVVYLTEEKKSIETTAL